MMFLIVICCYRLRQCAVASERKEFTRAQTKTITSLQGQDGAGGFFQCKNDFFGEKTMRVLRAEGYVHERRLGHFAFETVRCL